MPEVTYGHATVDVIDKAEPFTLFKGNRRGKKKGEGEYWAIFEISWVGFSKAVYDKLDELGVSMKSEFEPEYSDELRLHEKEHEDKTDADAWIPALKDGWDLMKIPDDIGAKTYRLMVTNHPEA